MPTDRVVGRRALLRGSVGLAALAAGCSTTPAGPGAAGPTPTGPTPTDPTASGPTPTGPTPTPTAAPTPAPTADAATVARRATLPVLCWHQLRDWRAADSAYSRRFLICPPAHFRAQLDALAEDGWTTLGPDEYLAHLTGGAPLPDKAVLLSFDDSQGSQVTEGLPQLRRRDMTGTFFCMTVVLDKPDWMSRDDLRRLADAGMTVAAHTWDHSRADRWSGTDWARQLQAPRELLEKVVRRPVEHFAYPYGAWAPVDFRHLAAAGYRTAFQLADEDLDRRRPLYTLRRTLVDSTWSGADLLRQVRRPA